MRKILIMVLVVAMGIMIFGCGSAESSDTENETDIEKFARQNDISVAFATSIDTSIRKVSDKYGKSFSISQCYDFEETDAWAYGKRYHIYLDYEYVLYIYEQDGDVVSIRKSNGEFVYQK